MGIFFSCCMVVNLKRNGFARFVIINLQPSLITNSSGTDTHRSTYFITHKSAQLNLGRSLLNAINLDLRRNRHVILPCMNIERIMLLCTCHSTKKQHSDYH